MHQEKLTGLLDRFNEESRGINIEASEIVTTDGLSLAASLPAGIDADRVGPLCAGAFALSRAIAKEFDMGELGQVIIKGSKSSALVNFAGEQTILTLRFDVDANIDEVNEAVKNVSEEIRHSIVS